MLFIALTTGMRQMAEQGMFVEFLSHGKSAVLIVSAMLFGAGLCIQYGGRWGWRVAYAASGMLVFGMAMFSVGLAVKAPGIGVPAGLSGYGLCTMVMALILLKGLISYGNDTKQN